MPANRAESVDRLLSYRLTEVPRRADGQDGGSSSLNLVDLRAALIGALAAGSPVASCWLRRTGQAPVNILLGGSGLEATRDGEQVRLLFPPGTRARLLPDDAARAALAGVAVWTRCHGHFDPSGLDRDDDDAAGMLGTLEEYFAHLSAHQLCWLVTAVPLPDADLKRELDEVAVLQPEIQDRAERALDLRMAAERAERWYRELDRLSATGAWQVQVLVGSESEPLARQAASLLCNTRDIALVPYRLRPGQCHRSLAEALEESGPAAGRDGGFPFRASSELLAALIQPPRRELPGVRVVRPPEFDVTSESSGEIRLGWVMDRALAPCGDFRLATGTLNRHAFVCGATGFGKSQSVRTMLEQLTAARINWLVIEPAKGEYRRMAGRLGSGHRLVVIRPGAPGDPAVSLNPLEPGTIRARDGRLVTFPLQTHLDLVKALFVASFETIEPFPQILAAALNRCYEDLGWELAIGSSALTGRASDGQVAVPRYPRLADLQRSARRVVEEADYGTEVKNNVKGLVDVRLSSLRLGAPGRFFEGGHPLDMAALMRSDVVLELESIGDDRDKAFFIGVVIIRLVELLRLQAEDGETRFRHVTVIEEAHRLLRSAREGPVAHAVEMFAALLAEVRAYGEGVVVAEQIPAKIVPDVIKNTALKLVHRLPAEDDRDSVGATMNLTEEQSEYVVTLGRGWAAAFAEGMDRPLLVKVDNDGEAREGSPGTTAEAPLAQDVGPRGTSPCGARCRRRPACTLGHLVHAQRLTRDPALVILVELTVAAHLCGDTPPALSGPSAAQLRARHADRDALACALGQLCQAAVDARYRPLAAHYQPEELGTHVAASLAAQLWEGGRPCGREPRWFAGQYRWRDVFEALMLARPGARVPVDADWARRGLLLSGSLREDLWEQVRRQSRSGFGEDELLHGAGRPSALDRACRELSGARGPRARLAEASAELGIDPASLPARLYPDVRPNDG